MSSDNTEKTTKTTIPIATPIQSKTDTPAPVQSSIPVQKTWNV